MRAASSSDERERLAKELSELEAKLVQSEMELAACEADIAVFQRRYVEEIGRRLDRISELQSAIEEAIGEAEKRSDRATLKSLYRRLAKRLHPDLDMNEDARVIRTRWMARLTEAYAKGDRAALQELERELDATGLDPEKAHQLEALRIQIAQIRGRLSEISCKRQQILSGSIGELWAESQEAASETRDLLVEMASELDAQIRNREADLAGIRLPT